MSAEVTEQRTQPRLLAETAGTLLAAADARLLKALAGRGVGGIVLLERVAEAEDVTVAFVKGRLSDRSFRSRYRMAVDAARATSRRAQIRGVR